MEQLACLHAIPDLALQHETCICNWAVFPFTASDVRNPFTMRLGITCMVDLDLMKDLMSGKLHIDGTCADLGRISGMQRLFSRQQASVRH